MINSHINTFKRKRARNEKPAISSTVCIQPKEKVTWVKPASPFAKCNFDAGFHTNTTQGTGGWIIRDHYGEAKAWGSSMLDHIATLSEAETKALLEAICNKFG